MTRPHAFDVRIYYEDTDLGGVVYYANYLKFLERARTEVLRSVGIDQVALKEEQGMLFVVRRIAVEYLRPGRFDDLVTVTTRVGRARGAVLEMRQEIRRGEVPLVTADVTVACVTPAGRPVRLPADLAAAMSGLGHG